MGSNSKAPLLSQLTHLFGAQLHRRRRVLRRIARLGHLPVGLGRRRLRRRRPALRLSPPRVLGRLGRLRLRSPRLSLLLPRPLLKSGALSRCLRLSVCPRTPPTPSLPPSLASRRFRCSRIQGPNNTHQGPKQGIGPPPDYKGDESKQQVSAEEPTRERGHVGKQQGHGALSRRSTQPVRAPPPTLLGEQSPKNAEGVGHNGKNGHGA